MGKAFSSRRGSLVNVNKASLGVTSIDLSTMGGLPDSLPRVHTPYCRRVAAGSTEDFEDDYEGVDDDDDDDEYDSRDRGDSIAVSEKILLVKLQTDHLGGPPGTPILLVSLMMSTQIMNTSPFIRGANI